MLIKHSISFGLKTSKTPADEICGGDREYPIRMRITYCGIRVDVPLGISIHRDQWNSENGLAKKEALNRHGQTGSVINATLAEYQNYVEDLFKGYEIEKTIPSAEMFKEALRKTVKEKTVNLVKKRSKAVEFSVAFKAFTRESGIKNAWTPQTYEKFDALWNDLQAFNKNLRFEDLTEEGLTQFVIYLRDTKKIKKKKATGDQEDETGLKNSTIGKKLDFLKWFLNWATEKGYNSLMDYKSFKPKLKSTKNPVVFLSEQEIKKLCDYQIPEGKKHLERVRDVFVFCCYSSLRYSDVENLKKSDVKDSFIDVTTVKTADSIRIEFNKVTQRILDKYKDVPIPGDKALPVISNQKMNAELKELCKLADISEPVRKTFYKGNERRDVTSPKHELVSTHTGRRSFICNALAKGIPVNVVMQWTGHADYKSMKPYVDVADSIRVQEMQKFNTDDIKI